MIKVAITGHTSGLGKCLFEQCKFEGYDVTGYSRSEGYDVGEPRTWDQIVWNEYDVVFNNAWHPTGQYGLLKHLAEQWQGKKKTIVNIGSWGSDFKYRGKAFDYALSKRNIEDLSNYLTANEKVMRVMMFKPGYMDTPMAAKADDFKMDPDAVAEVIMYMTFSAPYSFKEITMIPHEH